MQRSRLPGNSAATFLTHFFGSGLAVDRYVVERFKADADGEIRPWPGEAPTTKRRKAKRVTATLSVVREPRPARTDIIICTTPESVLMHLCSVFSGGELAAKATTKEFLVVRTEGRRRVRRRLKHYNPDAIVWVGHRVNSRQGACFRQWATRTLRDTEVQAHGGSGAPVRRATSTRHRIIRRGTPVLPPRCREWAGTGPDR